MYIIKLVLNQIKHLETSEKICLLPLYQTKKINVVGDVSGSLNTVYI